MEEELLAEDNACGQTLLHLVSRGNAIVAELLRLKQHIPHMFRMESKQDKEKYGELLMDFSYFSSDTLDKKIEKVPALYKLDEEIRECYSDLLERFYLAYESIYKYISDLNSFIQELEDGVYLQYSIDTLLSTTDGLQLICESIYLYGVQLLILDIYHSGPVRERLVVAHSRYSISAPCIDKVCRLIRQTGASPSSHKRPPMYPVNYFRRIEMKEKVIDSVISKLRTEDIYHQSKCLPDDTTTALASQASVLYILLYFSPNILNSQPARMREIVDKFFPDNWVINIYMGVTVNLIEMWDGFKAAKAAISNTVESTNIKDISNHHFKQLKAVLKKLGLMLKEGYLTKTSVLNDTHKILCLIRESNVTLRWLILHTSVHTTHSQLWSERVKRCKQVEEEIMSEFHEETLLVQLLLKTSVFEHIVTDTYTQILEERSIKWTEAQKQVVIRLEELSDIFAGIKQLVRISKSESLRKWFTEMKTNVSSLSLEEANVSARKIIQLLQALQEVSGYPNMESNLQTKQLVLECHEHLNLMLSAASVRDSLLVQVQVITDFSYGWNLVNKYTPVLQKWVTNDPTHLNSIRSLLHKLSGAMDSCLLRMNQAHEEGDLNSVSLYYSGRLVSYAKDLLQVIPSTVFKLMSSIAYLQTSVIPELPARLDKDKLKKYAQLDARFQVANESSQVCVFSCGLARMETTSLGVVRIEPKLLLEQGIRVELSQHIRQALSNGLVFNQKNNKSLNLSDKLNELSLVMEGHRKSFQYIQDYMDISGSNIWQEELSRVIEESVEEESDRVRYADNIAKLQQSDNISNPTCFMSRLALHIIQLTDPRVSIFIEGEWSWYSIKTKKKVLDSKIWAVLCKAMSPVALHALSNIIGFHIVKHLQMLINILTKECQNNKCWNDMLSNISNSLKPNTRTLSDVNVYSGLAGKVYKLTSILSNYLPNVGCLQILRKQIAYTQQLVTNTQAPLYASTLNTINQHLLDESNRSDCEQDMSDMLSVLSRAGLYDPYTQIYITSMTIPYLALLTFLYTTTFIPNFTYNKHLDGLMSKKSGGNDCHSCVSTVCVGISTLLTQYDSSITTQYISYCCQYAKSHLINSLQMGKEIDADSCSSLMLLYLEDFIEYGQLSRRQLTSHIPESILDLFLVSNHSTE